MSGDDELPPTEAPAPPSARSGTDSTPARPQAARRDVPSLPRALLEALRERRPEAMAAFYDAYFDRIHGYVRRMVRDEHLAEDVTQDIFMHLHRALPSYDPARDLRPWVFTIATNKLRDLWQSRRFQESRRQVSLDDDDAQAYAPPAAVPQPRGQIEAAELGAAVAAAIERLPESLRVPFWLRWHEELDFSDIAEHIGRSEVAVRKRYSRALAELRRILGGWVSASEGGGA